MTNTTCEAIAKILFELDPMGTCCKENGLLDEYDGIASGIAESIQNGASIESALQTEFQYWFDVTLDEGKLSALRHVIQKIS